MNSPVPSHDDRPEHIHMVVCGIAFFLLYVLLRVFHWGHVLASVAVLVTALPLMYIVLPISTWIYFLLSKPETRRTTIHVTDAGCSTLVYFLFVFLAIGVIENRAHHKLQTSATQHRR